MSAIRHGREQLPAHIKPAPADLRFRCGWCEFTDTRDKVNAHEQAAHADELLRLTGDPALLYCPESGGQPGEDNTTHHLVWTRPGAPCRYCGQTRQQLREAMRT